MNGFIDITMRIGEFLLKLYTQLLPSLQRFSLIITGVILFFVVYMLRKLKTIGMKRDKFLDKWGLIDLSKEKMRRMWADTVINGAKGGDIKMKKAIAEADKVLDEALKSAGIIGKNIEDRLAKTDEVRVSNIRELREAHRLAARLQQDPKLPLAQNEGWNIIAIYEKALKELGLLK